VSSDAKYKIPVRDDEGKELGETSVFVARADGTTALIVAHGAGGTMDTPSIRSLQSRLTAEGVTSVRFNFLYRERGKRSPDRQPALLACWRSVADWTKQEIEPKRLILAGRSMGGRMASYLVADGYPCDALVFLAYPLHPPGKPDNQRREHLASIRVPMLFISGTRDNFAYLDLLEPLVKELGAELHLVEGGDHGFKVPKKLGKTPEEIDEEVATRVLEFIRSLAG
jgi:predicted alpha/beta-hydrolase family hydrolase